MSFSNVLMLRTGSDPPGNFGRGALRANTMCRAPTTSRWPSAMPATTAYQRMRRWLLAGVLRNGAVIPPVVRSPYRNTWPCAAMNCFGTDP